VTEAGEPQPDRRKLKIKDVVWGRAAKDPAGEEHKAELLSSGHSKENRKTTEY
jgi:hypothetical protein